MPRRRSCPPIHLITCVGVDSQLSYLGHFLDHYRALGIAPQRMHVILNARRHGASGLAAAQTLLAQHGTAQPILWIAPYTSDAMWAERRAVQARRVLEMDWVVNADLDELHEYPECLEGMVRLCMAQGANCAQGVLVDRLAQEGAMPPADAHRSLWQDFPLVADVQCAIGGEGQFYNYYGTVKIMVHRGDVFPSRGGHFPESGATAVRYLFGRNLAAFPQIGEAGFRFAVPLRVHHFKWTAGLVASLKQRLATPGVSAAGAEYGAYLLSYLQAHGGIRLEDVSLCNVGVPTGVHWRLRLRYLQMLNAAYWYRSKLRERARRLLSRVAI